MASGTLSDNLQVEVNTRQILKIALPISLALLVPQINFVVNNVFISGLGESELGTAGITGVCYLIFALAGNGLNNGVQALLARRAGQNLPGEIGRLFMQGTWIAIIFAIAAILITYLAGPWVLSHSIHSEKVYNDAIGFLKIRIWGLPFLYFFQICNALLVGTNSSKYMKYGFWIQAAMNILLDYGLIYGRLGMPELGFNGAAWASLIAELAGMLVVLGILLYKKFHLRFSLFLHWRFNTVLSGLIFRQSSPLVAQYLLSIIAWVLFYILIEHKGERELAISNTMRNIFGIFGIFSWAFASTANTMVSNVIGQDKHEKVIALIKKITRLSMGFTFFLCLIVNIFPDVFLSIYGRDSGFTADAIPVIRIVSVGILCMAAATVWLNSVTGTGNTKINLAIEAAAILLYSVYIYFVLKVWNLSLVWAWTSELLYWTVLFGLSYMYIRSGKWKGKVI